MSVVAINHAGDVQYTPKNDQAPGVPFGTITPTNQTYPLVAMTGFNTPTGYVASASSDYPTDPAWRAFNKTVATGWNSAGNYDDLTGDYVGITGRNSEWLQIQLPVSIALQSYTISPHPTAWTFGTTPRNFTMQGSTNGVTWVVIDTRTNETNWTNGTPRTFTIANTQSFSYYRLDTTAVNIGYTELIIRELELTGYIPVVNTTWTSTASSFLQWLQSETSYRFPGTFGGTQVTTNWWQTALTPLYTGVGSIAGSGKYVGSVVLPNGRVVFVPSNATGIGLFDPVTNTFTTTGNITGTNKYYGGVLLQDGRVCFIPRDATGIGLFNPTDNSFTTTGNITGTDKYFGGVLLPDGRVCFVPNGVTGIGLFNPVDNSFTTTGNISGGYRYVGGVLLPDGRVVFVPGNSTGIGLFNPTDNSFTTTGNISGNAKFSGGVLLPDGRVVFVPASSTDIGVFNPTNNSYTAITLNANTFKYAGGVLLPDGRVCFIPGNETGIGLFNPRNNTFTTTGNISGTFKFSGGSLLQDGRVCFVPAANTTIGLVSGFPTPSIDQVLHPCFNKF